MTDLFTSAGVDVPPTPKGMAYPATYQAARLLEMVEGLWCAGEGFSEQCAVVARYARKIGAHSVARACCWGGLFETFDRHGYERIHIRMEAAAERYLARVEAKRLEAWGR